MGLISLRDAIARWQREERAPANAYEWYRRDAHRSGMVSIGETSIRATKAGGSWLVDEADLDRALVAHRERRAEVRRVTADYKAGVLHGHDGEMLETEWGGYRRRDPFHFAWSDYEVGRRRSDGTWYCSRCMRPASTEHNNPECHTCSDWGSCRNDCTLSRVSCPTCGTELALPPMGMVQFPSGLG